MNTNGGSRPTAAPDARGQIERQAVPVGVGTGVEPFAVLDTRAFSSIGTDTLEITHFQAFAGLLTLFGAGVVAGRMVA